MGKAVNSHTTPPHTRAATKQPATLAAPRPAPKAVQAKTASHAAPHAQPRRTATPAQPRVAVPATRPTPKPPPVYKPSAQASAAQQKRALPTQAKVVRNRVAALGAVARGGAKHPRATPQTPSPVNRAQTKAALQRLKSAPASAARPAVPPSPVKPSPTRPARPAAAALIKSAPARPTSTPKPAPRAAAQRGGIVQRSKLSGVGSGNLSNAEKNSGWAVYAQVNFTPTQSATTQSSNPSQTLQEVLGEDLLDDEHTHAEDKVLAIIPQRWLELKQPSTPISFDLYITSSPCSSTYGTTKKSEGCAESLARYYKEGVPIVDAYGFTEHVKFQINTLTVKKLYRPKGVIDAKDKSLNALVMLKALGVCKKFVVEN